MSIRATIVSALATTFLGFACVVARGQEAPAAEKKEQKPQKIYELRIYVTNEGKLPELNARFRDHTMKLFEKHGMENVIYWTLAEDFRGAETKANTLIYILAHKSREAADESWRNFRADPEWQAALAKSEVNGPLTASPPQSIYMNPTDFHPGEWNIAQKNEAPARLFELRIYNDGEARVPSTVGRFRDWEAELFRNSGIQTLGFWTKADNSAFVYLLGHKDRETATAQWQTFMTGFQARGGAGGGRGRNQNPNPQVQEGETKATGQSETKAAEQPAEGGAARQGRRGGRGGRGGGGGSEIRWLVPTDYSPRK